MLTPMNQPDLKQIKAAVDQDPRNAELRYLLGAELAQQKEYDAAVTEMSTALELDPKLHFARFQLGIIRSRSGRRSRSSRKAPRSSTSSVDSRR
jgi:lipoprotein NlpI